MPRRLRGPRAWLATAAAGRAARARARRPAGPARGLVGRSRSGEGATAPALLRGRRRRRCCSPRSRPWWPCSPRPWWSTGGAPGRRASGDVTARLQTLGYAVPGTVVAVAVYIPLAWIDRQLDGALDTGLLLTGTAIGLVLAYVVRFQALALLRGRRAHGPAGPCARRRGAVAGRRPLAGALRRPPAAAVAGHRHRRGCSCSSRR